MLGFMLFGLLLSATVGVVMGLCLTAFAKDTKHRIIGTTIIALIIGFGLVSIIYHSKNVDDKLWNNGFCLKCESGRYELQTVTSYKMNKEYYYKCDSCGYTIELNSFK